MKKLVIGITAPSSVILLKGQLAYFKSIGYECYLLAPENERTIEFCEEEKCELLPVDIQREISIFSDLKSLVTIIKHFKRVKPDIVNVGTPKMGLLGSLAGKLTGVKRRIYTCRGYRFEHETGKKKKLLVTLEKLAASSVHKVICISESVRQVGVDYNIFDKKKAVVINKGSSNGIELERFDSKKVNVGESQQLKEELSLHNDFIYGFVGRLIDRKGIGELFIAFQNVLKKYPKSKLLLVGPIEESQIKNKQVLVNLQNHPHIKLVGKQLNVPLYLSIMDVFVLPAWWEGFGNVLVQAAAMGKPVLSTTGTGSRDAVKHDFNGILVEPKNVEQLTMEMLRLQENEGLRNRLGRNGIEWSKNFDSTKIWEGMHDLYNKN